MDEKHNSSFIESARKALSPEQQEEYKRMGEYMYNNTEYNVITHGSKVSESKDEDLIIYATQALRSGLNPMDLTQEELNALIYMYGDEWYLQFDYEKDEVPEQIIKLVTPEQVKDELTKREQEKRDRDQEKKRRKIKRRKK